MPRLEWGVILILFLPDIIISGLTPKANSIVAGTGVFKAADRKVAIEVGIYRGSGMIFSIAVLKYTMFCIFRSRQICAETLEPSLTSEQVDCLPDKLG